MKDKHELLWTMDSFFADKGNDSCRAYCLCGWVADGEVTGKDMRLSFIKHLEHLNKVVVSGKVRGRTDKRVL